MSVLLSPLNVGGITLKNRVVMSPMLMYAAEDDGLVTDLHVAHYSARMLGGVGMVMVEGLAISPEGRIAQKDLGVWSDAHVPGLSKLVAMARATNTVIGVQLQHAGRKSTAGRQLVAPSPVAYGDFGTPEALTTEGIAKVVEDFRQAAARAVAAGVDAIEIHAGHGYLIHEFLSPVANRRKDEYGGGLENRMRLLLDVVATVRETTGPAKPLFVRMPASDVLEDGLAATDGYKIATALAEAGVEVLDVSTGNITPGYAADVYPGYQLEYANALMGMGCQIAAFGSLHSPELADYVVSSGTADLVFIGRALLRDPFWVLRAAETGGGEVQLAIPSYARATGPYERGF